MMCGTCEYNDVCPDAFTRASDYCGGPDDIDTTYEETHEEE